MKGTPRGLEDNVSLDRRGNVRSRIDVSRKWKRYQMMGTPRVLQLKQVAELWGDVRSGVYVSRKRKRAQMKAHLEELYWRSKMLERSGNQS